MKEYMRPVVDWVRLGRPLFLAGGFIFHGLGVAVALFSGAALNLSVLLWGQIAITAIQWMTHYGNEYFDLPADRASDTPTRWASGSRVLPEGALSPPVALVTAIFFALVALAATAVLAFWLPTGPLTAPLLLLALLLAWEYTAPPLKLHWRGLGELAGAILVPGMTTLVGFYLQRGQLAWLPVVAVFSLCCLQAAMLLAVNFPDAAGDMAVGKKTLVVRLGGSRAAWLYMALVIGAYVSLPFLTLAGLPLPVAVAASLPLPVASWQLWRMWRGAWAWPAAWESLAFWSIGLMLATAVLQAVAFLWLLQ